MVDLAEYYYLSPVLPKLEDYFQGLRSDELRQVAGRYLGKGAPGGSKQRSLELIQEILASPERLRARMARLPQHVRAGLGLLRRRGGKMPRIEFALELLTLGHPVPQVADRYRYDYYSSYTHGRSSYHTAYGELLAEGLVGDMVQLPRTALETLYYEDVAVLCGFTDLRLLEYAEPSPPLPLPLTPVAAPSGSRQRRPAEVTLRLVTLLEALRSAGPFELTQRGRAPKTFVNKLGRALKWDKAPPGEEVLEDQTLFYFQLLYAAGLIEAVLGTTQAGLREGSEAVLDLAISDQGRIWANAYQSLVGWTEFQVPHLYVSAEDLFRPGIYNAARAMLCTALGALPDPDGWYRATELITALHDRVGAYFGFSYAAMFYPPYGLKGPALDDARARWAADQKRRWLVEEGEWIRQALRGPLFQLGFVEVAEDSGSRSEVLFRLTPLGHDALYNRLRPTAENRVAPVDQEPAAGAWVVQANGDVVVYLDRATPRQLTFLARIARRQPGTGLVATYRITQESVYTGLEGGLSLAEVQEQLERGAVQPVPAPLKRNLEDWAARREKLSVYPLAEVLQYPDRASRDAALRSRKVEGEPVADTFLLRTAPLKRSVLQDAVVIDYRQPPPRCWDVAETGELTFHLDAADFFAEHELANWAEPTEDPTRWRVTRESVERAAQGGWDGPRILQRLAERCRTTLPPLLETTIRNWTRRGGSVSAALARQLVLQVAGHDAAEALWGSSAFKGFFRTRLGPHTFLVAESREAELLGLLEQHGFVIGDDLALASR